MQGLAESELYIHGGMNTPCEKHLMIFQIQDIVSYNSLGGIFWTARPSEIKTIIVIGFSCIL